MLWIIPFDSSYSKLLKESPNHFFISRGADITTPNAFVLRLYSAILVALIRVLLLTRARDNVLRLILLLLTGAKRLSKRHWFRVMFIRAQSFFIICAKRLKFASFFRDEGIRVVKFTFPYFVTLAISPFPAWWDKFLLVFLFELMMSQDSAADAAAAAAAAADAAAALCFTLLPRIQMQLLLLTVGFIWHRLVLPN